MENLQKRPSKGILKSSSSFEQPEVTKPHNPDIKWDEMNIIQTLHPPGKDYGLMKVEEPKTPYSYFVEEEDGDGDGNTATASKIISSLSKSRDRPPKVLAKEDSGDDYEEMTEEEEKHKKEFEMKRKLHYNEFEAVKLARKLLAQEEEEEEDENRDEIVDAEAKDNEREKIIEMEQQENGD